MDLTVVLLIAVGLAMDAFAVSIASGIGMKNLGVRHALLIALFFGGFQALMPVLGWAGGRTVAESIAAFDHWLAFGLLSAIGIKMIYEAFRFDEAERGPKRLSLRFLLVLSVATSIDALAVGLSFAFLDVGIATPAIIIGIVTFIMSFAGVYLGKRVGHLFEGKIEIIGGLILIGIGTKILIEHLS